MRRYWDEWTEVPEFALARLRYLASLVSKIIHLGTVNAEDLEDVLLVCTHVRIFLKDTEDLVLGGPWRSYLSDSA